MLIKYVLYLLIQRKKKTKKNQKHTLRIYLKQINQYINEYHYSYSGILKSLTYFYEIKGNSLDKANGGIGIVPYVYKNAYNYYFAIWEAQQKNEGKVIEEYKPKVKEVVIPIPKRKVRKRRLFAFLDEEDD